MRGHKTIIRNGEMGVHMCRQKRGVGAHAWPKAARERIHPSQGGFCNLPLLFPFGMGFINSFVVVPIPVDIGDSAVVVETVDVDDFVVVNDSVVVDISVDTIVDDLVVDCAFVVVLVVSGSSVMFYYRYQVLISGAQVHFFHLLY